MEGTVRRVQGSFHFEEGGFSDQVVVCLERSVKEMREEKMKHLCFLGLLMLLLWGCSSPPLQPEGELESAADRKVEASSTEANQEKSQPPDELSFDAGVEPVVDAGTPDDSLTPEKSQADSSVRESITEPVAPDSGTSGCPQGVVCVDRFPFRYEGDTRQSSSSQFDRYNCKTSADESGPEVIFRVEVKQEGFLSAAVFDDAGVDVDVHILSRLDPNACLHRGDKHTRADVKPGVYYVVVDSYVKSGKALSGKFRVDIGLYLPSRGRCDMQSGEMKRVRDGGKSLKMPATGPMVMEAHLVSQDEPPPYPKTSTDKLKNHYEISQKKTGFVMHRTQSWAPLEGGTFYGAGIGSPKLFPLLHEGWYVNMYWQKVSRPARGTRMILRIPGTNRAVVVAAGYETGPGNLANIGGTTEETHFYLKTIHKSKMTLGIAKDQTLPYGPRVCQD